MKVRLALYLDNKLTSKSSIVNELSSELEKHFQSNKYGDSLEELYFGIVSMSEEFKAFFKPRKPKFTKAKKMFECDIEFDFEQFRSTDDSNLKGFILEGILKSLQVISEKVKDFDINAFENDLKQLV
ncbi:MAG: Imm44 family immunity protein [Candidatus Paceibacterota bacterium]